MVDVGAKKLGRWMVLYEVEVRCWSWREWARRMSVGEEQEDRSDVVVSKKVPSVLQCYRMLSKDGARQEDDVNNCARVESPGCRF